MQRATPPHPAASKMLSEYKVRTRLEQLECAWLGDELYVWRYSEPQPVTETVIAVSAIVCSPLL